MKVFARKQALEATAVVVCTHTSGCCKLAVYGTKASFPFLLLSNALFVRKVGLTHHEKIHGTLRRAIAVITLNNL